MLSAYYFRGCDSRKLFAPFKIAGEKCFEEKLNKYNVIKLDMNSEYQNTMDKSELIKRLAREVKAEMVKEFPSVGIPDDDSLAQSILRIYAATGETFIIIMDEYDVLVREQVSEDLFAEYLSFLNGLFKRDTLRPAISLAYLTGILPVVRDKIQSKLNNFREYTILDSGELAEFIGFTGEEVRQLCDEYNVDYEECRRRYDGYRQRGFEIYNPESVVRSIEDGYLAYNREDKTCRISNWEIRQEWYNAIETESEYKETNKIIKASRNLLADTLSGDEEAVARALDISHIHVTSNRSYNNEDALQSAIYLAYLYALNEYTIIKEMTTGKGFADVVFIPFKENRQAMVIELKRNDCKESAIEQIKEKKYFDSLKHYSGNLLLVGINYDAREKTHTCKIERLDHRNCYKGPYQFRYRTQAFHHHRLRRYSGRKGRQDSGAGNP